MKINFLGDIGIFRKYEELGIDPFNEIQLPQADINIGNFEFVIPKNRDRFFYDVQDNYSCSYEYLRQLHVNKFHGFGMANNHALDYGIEGAKDTVDFLRKKGIEVFGFSNDSGYNIGVFEKNGIRIGVLAFVKDGRWSKKIHGYGPDTYNVKKICDVIQSQIDHVDHFFIYPHWGTELIEIPEYRDTENAKKFIDAGATAVIGHHPHISQGIESYGKGVIAYSLGSFIYLPEEELGYSAKQKNREISICMHLELDRNEIISYKAHYYKYNRDNKVPKLQEDESIRSYAGYINSIIYDVDAYKKQVRHELLRREIKSFWQRFKTYPIKTMVNYMKLFRLSKLKKLVG